MSKYRLTDQVRPNLWLARRREDDKQFVLKLHTIKERYEYESAAASALEENPLFVQLVDDGFTNSFTNSRAWPLPAIVYEVAQFTLLEFNDLHRYTDKLMYFMIDLIYFLGVNNLAHRDIKPMHILVFMRDGEPHFAIGELLSVVRIGPSTDAIFDDMQVLDQSCRCYHKFTFGYVPDALVSSLEMNLFTDMPGKLRWINLYAAFAVIKWSRLLVAQEDDPIVQRCTQGMAATTLEKCNDLWEAFVDSVKLSSN